MHEFRKLVFKGKGASEVGSPGILVTVQGYAFFVPYTLNKRCYTFSFSKSYHCTGMDRLLDLQGVEPPRISRRSAHGGSKVASRTHRPLPPGDIPGIQFCYGRCRFSRYTHTNSTCVRLDTGVSRKFYSVS